jgi:hypothetical protein
MGYEVRPGKPFRLLLSQFQEGKRKYATVPKSQWGVHGFREDMPIDEARGLAATKNKDAEVKRHAGRALACRERVEADGRALTLGVPLAEEFAAPLEGKQQMHWRTVMRTIIDLRLQPTDYAARKEECWRYWQKKTFSPSYVDKLTQMMNKYGTFWSWKHQRLILPMPYPTGSWRQKLKDASANAPGKGGKESAPLTPRLLESKKSKFKPAQYAWLYLSVWLGLRPAEVDSLHSARNYRVTKGGGVPVLEVYQSKLMGIDEEKRWKRIPLFHPEMVRCLAIISGGSFVRPLTKTVSRVFGEEYGLYGGRKGFMGLMLDFDQSLEDISLWMGHTTVERTWRSYRSRQRVHFKKLA